MRAESRMLFWHQKGFWLILLYVSLRFLGLLFLDTPVNKEIERYKEGYDYYLKQVEGRCTKQTKQLLAETAQQIAAAEQNRQRLYGDYYDGKLSKAEFTAKAAAATEAVRYQKGFELLYEQYNGIRENTKNRWFLYPNGWDGLLSNDKLELLFVLLLLLLITPMFCQEYECEMDKLILTAANGSRHHAWHKLVLAILLVCILCLLNSSMQYLFFNWKYGLPNGDYPLQSLSYFAASTRTITLLGAFLEISVGRLLGSLSLTILLLFVAVWVKKYALTLFAGISIILLPYYSFTLPSTKYLLPGPLGLIISTGLFRGNEYRYDAVSQEKVLVFQEIGKISRWHVLAITLGLMLLMGIVILKRSTNRWDTKKYHRAGKARYRGLLFVFLITACFSGCSTNKKQSDILFNLTQSNTYANEDYRFFVENPDSEEAAWMMEDKVTGQVKRLVRNPLGANTKVVEKLFGTDSFVYYMQVDSLPTGFLKTSNQLSVIEVNLKNFSEKTIFSRSLDSGSDRFFNLGQPNEQELEPFRLAEAFFLDDQNFYFLSSQKVYQVNRVSQKMEVIVEAPVMQYLSFDGRYIYYINEISKLMMYDVVAGRKEQLFDVVTDAFFLADKEVVFINRLAQNKLYALNLADGTQRQLTREAILSFTIEGSTIVYTEKANQKEHQINLKDES